MNYIAIHCKVIPLEPFAEILISQLAEIGFDMFEENEAGFDGFIRVDAFNVERLNEVEYLQPNDLCNVTYELEEIASVNWNEEWEKNFNPVSVKNVYIRAPFHEADENAELDIVIQPKMSFGTGHHATTAMMVELMLETNLKNKAVLDMGCGSGILGILASKLGSGEIVAIDYDENCVINSIENTDANKVRNMQVLLGDATILHQYNFDVVLANINRNILVNDIYAYVGVMKSSAQLLVSGFYEKDEEIITNAFSKYNLKKLKKLTNNKWCALLFQR